MNLRMWINLAVVWSLIAFAMTAFLHLAYDVDQTLISTFGRQLSSWCVFIPLNATIIFVFRSWFAKPLTIPQRVLGHLITSLVFSGAYTATMCVVRQDAFQFRRFMWALFIYVFIIAALRWLHDRRELLVRQEKTMQLERDLNEARFAAVEAQVQPHFLFNTLHAIGMTIGKDADKAREMLMVLGNLLRDSLGDNRPALVSLLDEFRRVKTYTQLLDLRYGRTLEITSKLDDDCRNTLLPPFSIQSLVENAMKHGIERRTEAHQIKITAQRENKFVVVAVEDDGPGFSANCDSDGSGLRNLADRLRANFDAQATIETGKSGLGGARVSIRVPLEWVPTAS